MLINYHDRFFRPVVNTENGEADTETLFHYRQEGDLVWATYGGGRIRFGTLVARIAADGSLDMRYQHMNGEGELLTGVCRSVPERLPAGRLRLHESWRWTCGDGSEGRSVVEEVRDERGEK